MKIYIPSWLILSRLMIALIVSLFYTGVAVGQVFNVTNNLTGTLLFAFYNTNAAGQFTFGGVTNLAAGTSSSVAAGTNAAVWHGVTIFNPGVMAARVNPWASLASTNGANCSYLVTNGSALLYSMAPGSVSPGTIAAGGPTNVAPVLPSGAQYYYVITDTNGNVISPANFNWGVSTASPVNTNRAWMFMTFDNVSNVTYLCTGPTPTNLTVLPTGVYHDPNGRTIRDPSIAYYNGTYLMAYNTKEAFGDTNPIGVAWSPDCIIWTWANYFTNYALNALAAPEWFIDPTNQLHLVCNGEANSQFTNYMFDVSWPGLFPSNFRQIGGVTAGYKSSDVTMVYTNATYFLFNSIGEWASPNLDTGYTNVTSNTTSEGNTIFNFNGLWYWLRSNQPSTPWYCSTSTNLTSWSALATVPWRPADIFSNQPGVCFLQGTMLKHP